MRSVKEAIVRSIATTVTGLCALFAVSCSDSSSPVGPTSGRPTDRPAVEHHHDRRDSCGPYRKSWLSNLFVRNVQLAFDRSLAIGLHPTRQPVAIQVEPGGSVEVCPATIDGDIDPNYSSWPRSSFESCVSLDSAGHASLPSTGGGTHVVFAIRSHDAAQHPTVDVL
jgi:hypothetical protein